MNLASKSLCIEYYQKNRKNPSRMKYLFEIKYLHVMQSFYLGLYIEFLQLNKKKPKQVILKWAFEQILLPKTEKYPTST